MLRETLGPTPFSRRPSRVLRVLPVTPSPSLFNVSSLTDTNNPSPARRLFFHHNTNTPSRTLQTRIAHTFHKYHSQRQPCHWISKVSISKVRSYAAARMSTVVGPRLVYFYFRSNTTLSLQSSKPKFHIFHQLFTHHSLICPMHLVFTTSSHSKYFNFPFFI